MVLNCTYMQQLDGELCSMVWIGVVSQCSECAWRHLCTMQCWQLCFVLYLCIFVFMIWFACLDLCICIFVQCIVYLCICNAVYFCVFVYLRRSVSACRHLCSAELASYALSANWIGCAEYGGCFMCCLYFQRDLLDLDVEYAAARGLGPLLIRSEKKLDWKRWVAGICGRCIFLHRRNLTLLCGSWIRQF